MGKPACRNLMDSYTDTFSSKNLARYMFRLKPDQALTEIEKVYAPKSNRQSEQFKTDSIQKVRSVVSGRKWWQELYAAEKMRQNKKLHDPELIEQLKNSEHAIVREAAQEIEQKNPTP